MKILLRAFMLFSISIIGQTIHSQDAYQGIYDLLQEEKYYEAIDLSEKLSENGDINAKIYHCQLLTNVGEDEKASKEFNKYLADNPENLPYIYSNFFKNYVTGGTTKKEDFNLDVLKELSKNKGIKGKMEANINYWLGLNEYSSVDIKKAQGYLDKIYYLNEWSFLGPFDNVMNSGFNKDNQVIEYPDLDHVFLGNYGQNIQWFTPPRDFYEGYVYMDSHFKGRSILMYAQCFVHSNSDQEVVIDFPYSGSAKLWLNDQLIYSESTQRIAGFNSFHIKTKLNEGYNRVLVQIGNYMTNNPNFSIRVLDSDSNQLQLESTPAIQPYSKKRTEFELIENFSVQYFKEKVASDPKTLNNYLNLADTYMRMFRSDEAEEVLKKAELLYPDNYFLIHNLTLFYNKVSNENNLNIYFDKYMRLFPNDRDVIIEKIRNESQADNKVKTKEHIANFKERYPNDDYNISLYNIALESYDENYTNVLSILRSLYNKYPNKKVIAEMQYNATKAMSSNPTNSNAILERYVRNNMDYSMITKLANEYIDEGNYRKAIKLYEKSSGYLDSEYSYAERLISIFIKQEKLDDALELCEYIAKRRPSDYDIYAKMADVYKYKDNTAKVEEYNKMTLHYFPFDFNYNEKIRKSGGKEEMMTKFKVDDPLKIIKDYEENYKDDKNSIVLVNEKTSLILYNTTSMARAVSYIVKLNDNDALTSYQQINFSRSSTLQTNVNKVQTIKPDGTRIDAERSGNSYVLTNLEIGDYVFVIYTEKQYDGGKTSKFFYDYFQMNGYYPIYDKTVDIYIQNGLELKYEFKNSDLTPEVSKVDDFTHYHWAIHDQKPLKEESNTLPFFDIGKTLYVTLDYQWDDIVDWYKDLSDVQAEPDFTIKKIAKDLFNDTNYTQEEKAKVIYDFIVKNIQYSSIDFRQGSYVPQKASDVYHTRLGDCKDVSTFFTSIAKEADIDANLVLIKTRDYGQNSVVVPSLNFNHCIVKLNLENEVKYIELTDPYLPFGYLNSAHEGAAILEISDEQPAKLKFLAHKNKGPSQIEKNSTVTILDNLKMKIETKDKRIGNCASNYSQNYLNETEDKRKEYFKSSLASFFKTAVSLNNLDFDDLSKRKEEININYVAEVEKEILNLGSLNTFRIPFTDLLADNATFQDTVRTFDMSYFVYEPYDKYHEKLTINIPSGKQLVEVPSNKHYEFGESTYDLKFNKLSDQSIEIERIFKTDRKVVDKLEYKVFRKYILQILEGENTHLVYK